MAFKLIHIYIYIYTYISSFEGTIYKMYNYQIIQLLVQLYLVVLHQHIYVILQLFWNLFNIIWKKIFVRNFYGYHPLLAKKGTLFFGKRTLKISPLLFNVNPFSTVLRKNKALYNFHKRGQHLTAGRVKGLDLGLVTNVSCQYAL